MADLVTVIIPTFNRRDLVVQSVCSVLTQSHGELTCLVVDNGSTDGTAEALAAIRDDRLRVLFHAEPIGASEARNLGIAATTNGEWVAFLDNDDLWAPTKLSSQLEALSHHPDSGWSAVGCVNVGPDLLPSSAGRIPGLAGTGWAGAGTAAATPAVLLSSSWLLETLASDNFIPAGGSSVLVKRSLLDAVGAFNADVVGCEDWDLWLRLAAASPLLYVDQPLVAYRVWNGQVSKDLQLMAASADRVLQRHFPSNVAARRAAALRWRSLSARRALDGGNRWSAARRYVDAAVAARAPGQMFYAGASILAPEITKRRLRAVERRDHLESWNIPADWMPALTWLESVRQPSDTSVEEELGLRFASEGK